MPVDVVVGRGRRGRRGSGRRGRRLGLEILEPDVPRQHAREVAEDLLPRDPLRRDLRHGHAARLGVRASRLNGRGLRLGGDDLLLEAGERLLLVGDGAVRVDERCDERGQKYGGHDRGGDQHALRVPAVTGAPAPAAGCACGKKVDSPHQTSTPSPIATASEGQILTGLDRIGDLRPSERVGPTNADARQALELFGQARHPAGPARKQDVADRERARLALVELKRGDKLAGERLKLAPHRLSSARGAVACVIVGIGVLQREAELELRCLRSSHTQLALDRAGECRTAPLEDAREVADGAVGDGERRPVVANRDGNDCGLRRVRTCRGHSAQKRERLEVDPDQLDSGLLAGGRVAVDRLAVGGNDEDAAVDLAGLVDRLAQNVIVENSLVERDRDGLVGAEANRVRELPVVLDAGDLEGADADAVRRDAEADAAARQPVLREELVERARERRHRTNLAGNDDPGREILPSELENVRRAVVRDSRRRELCRADLEADELALPLARLRLFRSGSREAARSGLLRPRRPPHQIRELDFLLQIHVHLSAAKRRPSVGRAGA